MGGDLLFYQFSRDKIEKLDFTHFLERFGPDKLPTGEPLQLMMNRMLFTVEGYDDDPREIYLIPEVRTFYSALHKAWPYSLYFANLDTENFQTFVLCLMQSIVGVQRDGSQVTGVEYDRIELARWLGPNFGPMNFMCEQAGMSERQIYDRTKALFEYFELPFDAPEP